MFSALARIGLRGPRTFRAARCCEYSTEADGGRTTGEAGAADRAEGGKPRTQYYRVTLYRSPIGLPKRRHDSLASLGLRRRMDVSYHRHSPDAAGLILSVKELLKVENVSEDEARLGKQSSRKLLGDNRGYRLIRNVLEPANPHQTSPFTEALGTDHSGEQARCKRKEVPPPIEAA